MTFRFEPPAHFAGQFLLYHLPIGQTPEEGEHYFTIAAAPDDHVIQISTRLTGSAFKNALNNIPVGGSIEAEGSDGDFIWDDKLKQAIFIAGGIGITPFRAILRQLQAEHKQPHIKLLYGNKTADEIVFRDELEEMARSWPGLTIDYVIQPDIIDAARIQAALNDMPGATVYVSGPEPMVEAMEKTLASLHIPEERQQRDYFPGYPDENLPS